MLKFHLLLFLFSTIRSKNLLVELADDNTTKSFDDKLGKIIQEMTEEDKALFSLIKGPGVFTNGGGDSDYMSVAESKRRGCRGIRNIRPCLNARDGTQCNAGGNPKWSNSECCNGCCRHTRNVYKKVPGAANSCGIYESFKRAMKNGCSGITNIAQCMNKPDGTSCSRGDKWPDSECCNGCCKHTYHVYKHVPDASNSCGLMASVKRAIADGCQGIPNFSQCLDKPDSTVCENMEPVLAAKAAADRTREGKTLVVLVQPSIKSSYKDIVQVVPTLRVALANLTVQAACDLAGRRTVPAANNAVWPTDPRKGQIIVVRQDRI